ncbi:hypothetical protein ANTPLA_LOCUS7572 [Anthophora plagiata]
MIFATLSDKYSKSHADVSIYCACVNSLKFEIKLDPPGVFVPGNPRQRARVKDLASLGLTADRDKQVRMDLRKSFHRTDINLYGSCNVARCLVQPQKHLITVSLIELTDLSTPSSLSPIMPSG